MYTYIHIYIHPASVKHRTVTRACAASRHVVSFRVIASVPHRILPYRVLSQDAFSKPCSQCAVQFLAHLSMLLFLG